MKYSRMLDVQFGEDWEVGSEFNSLVLRNEERTATIFNECKVSCPIEAKADITLVFIVTHLRVRYTIFLNHSIENATLCCLYSGEKSNAFTP